MLKSLGISALAALMALATLSITEAASSNEQDTLCRRSGYCYNQDDSSSDCTGGCYNGGYCERDRGCW